MKTTLNKRFLACALCIVMMLCLTACGGSGNEDVSGVPQLSTTEAPVNDLSGYKLVMDYSSINSSGKAEETYTIIYCNDGWFFSSDKVSGQLYDKDAQILYELNLTDKTKTVKAEGNATNMYADGNYTFSTYYNYLNSYNDYDASSFNVTATEEISGRECRKLELSSSLLPANSSVTYWVDNELNIAMKYSASVSAGDSEAITEWTVTEYTDKGVDISEYLGYTEITTQAQSTTAQTAS